MAPVRQRLSDLPPEELERLRQAHIDSMFDEIRAAGASLRASWHPLHLARRHPIAVAAAAGLALAWLLRKGRRPSASAPSEAVATAEPPPGRAFARSFLSGLASSAGRALPALITWGLARHGPSR